jgi:Neurotransmitter-gated ion-channel ligand binding domain/Neurotransmitter-gated ion-channel transmembrane region
MKVLFTERAWRRWLCFGLGLLLSFGLVVTGPTAKDQLAVAKEVSSEGVPQAKANAAELLKLLPDSRPVEVKVGLYVTNLADINQSSETFDIAGYLFYAWQDRRLAYNAKQVGTEARVMKLDEIWNPMMEMVNFKESKATDVTLTVAPNGTVSAQERFSKTLSSGLNLQRFPFDQERLQVVVESLLYPLTDVRFVVDESKLAIAKDSFVSLSEWSIQGVKGNLGKSLFIPEQRDYSRITMEVLLQRNSGFYVFKVMMPLLLITIASWSVFWIDAKEFSTQITIAFTNLLTVVALLLVVNDALPKVGYLTFMDGFTMLCFVAILAAIVELIWAHRWESRDDHEQAQKIHVMARWLVPSGFLVGCLGLWGFMFLV